MGKTEKVQKRHGRFPWGEWFKWSKFSLYRGKHYTCQPHGMAQMVRNAASRLGFQAQVNVKDEGRIDVELTKEDRCRG